MNSQSTHNALAAKLKTSVPVVLTEQSKHSVEKTESARSTLDEITDRLELFHSADNTAYATISDETGIKTLEVNKGPFADWLNYQFFRLTGKAIKKAALEETIGVLNAKAKFLGKQIEVYTRVAPYEDGVEIVHDLHSGSVVVVTSAQVSTKSRATSKFVKYPSNVSQVSPVASDKSMLLPLLRKYINATEQDLTLIVVWLLASFRTNVPCPLLLVQGEQGSAKSTLGKVLKSLLDPAKPDTRTLPSSERDLAIAAKNSHVLVYDNLSGITNAMSDALCRLVTGGGFATRKLQTDADEAIFDARRPMILNGIDDIAKRPDLLDRAISVHLPRISDSGRISECQFWSAFVNDKPQILGAIYQALSAIFATLPSVSLDTKPRMADFAIFGVAVERALDWEAGTFMQFYSAHSLDANERVLESDPLAIAIRECVSRLGSVEGTVTSVLNSLANCAGDDRDKRTWPTTRTLKKELLRLGPPLRKVGIGWSESRSSAARFISIFAIDTMMDSA
ncbi:MAG TPA: hypothetical protein V6C76_12735 [Drouetiella sp.]